jgi:hypothetical protein
MTKKKEAGATPQQYDAAFKDARATKLLVTAFHQRVIPATRLQTIQVFRHPMKHHFASNLCLSESLGFHARKHTVTTSGGKN